MAWPSTIQDPLAVLNYSFDWEEEWLAVGETIASRQWTITPAATLAGDTTATCFVSGLVEGTTYYLTEHIVTNGNVQDERTVIILCAQT